MELIAPFITALTMAISVMSLVWIYRKTSRIDSVHSVFAVGVIIYAGYHFIACGLGVINPMYGAVSGLFISSVAWVNAYCSTCNAGTNIVNIGVCRRKTVDGRRNNQIDRRKYNSQKLIQSKGPY